MTIHRSIPLAALRIDGGTQARVKINQEAVDDYAEQLAEGAEFPAVDVYFDGAENWLVDGFHRFHAHRKAQRVEINAVIHQGTQRDAILASIGANARHGLRRTNEDKRKAVATLLADPAWSQWSDNEIARRVGVSHTTVYRMRAELASSLAQSAGEKSSARTYTTKHGTQAVMDTSKIGRASPPAGKESAGQAPMPEAGGASTPPVSQPDPADPDNMTPEQAAEVAFGGDPVERLEAAYARMGELEAQIKAMSADDKAAEIRKWQAAAQVAQRRQDELQQNAKEYQDQAKWAMRQLRRCGKAVGEDDTAKVAATVEAFVRHAKVPA